MMTNIYLEIGPRQTGKTTRLVATATAMLRMGTIDHALIFGHKVEFANRIRKQFPKDLRKFVIAISPSCCGRGISNAGAFFDEFDFHSATKIMENMVVAAPLPIQYFCTTPRFIRKYVKDKETEHVTTSDGIYGLNFKYDPMAHLLQHTEGKYDTIIPYSPFERPEQRGSHLSAEQYACEIGGEFGIKSIRKFL